MFIYGCLERTRQKYMLGKNLQLEEIKLCHLYLKGNRLGREWLRTGGLKYNLGNSNYISIRNVIQY